MDFYLMFLLFEYLRHIVTPFNLSFVKAVEKNIRLVLLWVLYG